MTTLRSWIEGNGWLQGILLTSKIDALLSGLEVDPGVITGPVDGAYSGTAQVGGAAHPLFFDLSLAPLGPPLPFRFALRPDGFDLAFDLGQVPPATRLADLVADSAGRAFTPAIHNGVAGGEEWLTATAGQVKVMGATIALVIEGRKGAQATMRLGPSIDQPDGVVKLTLDPPTVMLGSSGFGLELPDGFFIDMSTQAAAPPASVDGHPIVLPGDTPAWKGLSIRNARFYLPESVPLFDRTAVNAQIEIGLDPVGIALSAEAHVPPRDGKPAMTVRIECVDPTATGLASFLPTLVEVAVELPVDQYHENVGGGTLHVLASRPLIARARFSRETNDAAAPTRLSIGIEAQGENGILAVSADGGGTAEKGFIAAGAFATALIAEKNLGSAGAGTPAAALLTAGMALSTLLNDKGRLVVHGVELATEGKPKGLSLTDKQTFTLDYAVDVVIHPIDLGVMSVSLAPEEPLRIRLRGVVLSLDHSGSGLGMIGLDYRHATMEVEDPGHWLVGGPGSLFDVLGSRSGRGSIWVEVDLRFKLNLGPVRVSGATIRATLDPETNKIIASIRGLDAQITMPGVIEGEGKVSVSNGGFEAMIRVNVVPVGFNAEASLRLQGQMVLLELAADLPGPLPLANSGLGLFGVGGTFGIATTIAPPAPGEDPIEHALLWDPQEPPPPGSPEPFNELPGNFTFGLEAVVGTLPDMGFAFSAKAGLFLTVPDLVVLGAIDATILSGRMSITHKPDPDPTFIALRGAIIVDPADAVTFGISGTLNIPVLLTAKIPSGGRFPVTGDTSDWYLYMGADGYNGQGRGIGPATVRVLPDIFNVGAYGYFMLRGDGIEKWPRGGPTSFDGFILAFGFGLDLSFGPRPIVWAEVHASADILVATSPLILAGFGHVDGSAHIGPVSVGVSADLQALISEGNTSIYAKVCGHVNLLFTKIRKCVELKFGSEPPLKVPPPTSLPLDRLEGGQIVGQNAMLIDDKYQLLYQLGQSPEEAQTVWPDALIALSFAFPPHLASGCGGTQFPTIDQYPEGDRARPFGSNLLDYQWELRSLQLFDVTGDEHGPGTLVSGELSAAWQAGRTGNPGTSAEPAELILFDIKGTFFIDRMSDPGQSLPGDPIGAVGHICRPDARARIGWTLGIDAVAQEELWRLPPEIISADPTQSRIGGLLAPGFTLLDTETVTPLDEVGRQALPYMVNYLKPRTASLASPTKVEREFAGVLLLEYAIPADGNELAFERLNLRFNATIYLDEPIASNGFLFLWAPSASLNGKGPGLVRVYDPKSPSQAWYPDTKDIGNGQRVLIFKAPGTVTALRIEWPATQQLGLLGLEGMTATALAAAQARNDAQAAAAATQQQAANDGPPTDTAHQSGASRCLLQPGKTYRIDVELAWTGTLYKQIMYGIRVPAATSSSDVDPTLPMKRSYFFKTTPVPPRPAPLPHPAPGGSVYYGQPIAALQFGLPGHLQTLHRAQDRFAPELLERHLSGYEPAQSEVARFRHDPLRAHFDVGHVEALAGLYNYTLQLGLRRTDTADASGNLLLILPHFSAALNPAFLSGADQRRYQVATGVGLIDGEVVVAGTPPCPVPKPGLTLDATAELQPRAWYEFYVHIKSTIAGAPAARLPGVSFQTSRWFAPNDMLVALGFGASASGTPTGDLEIQAVSGFARGPVLGDDGAFDDALRQIGLEGWPIAETPRTSLLWLPRTDDSGWDCAGVLIESPEPIHRDGRCTVDRLTAVLSPSHPAVNFNSQFRDRSGSRILFLTDTPFLPAPWLDLGHLIPGSKIPSGIFKRLAQPTTKIVTTRIGAAKTIIGKTTPQSPTMPVTPSSIAGHASQKIVPGGVKQLPIPLSHQPMLRLEMTDYRPDGTIAALTGLLALSKAPLFAGEAR
ncbi:hypothetical protein [Nitrobacter sp. JJSN]|uniref:hypothetical protein n=1 Tax=Nitrobacter sp. JJSN TaxID=3453033 RepID=UPI003F7752D7